MPSMFARPIATMLLLPLAMLLLVAATASGSEEEAEALIAAAKQAMMDWDDDKMNGVNATVNLTLARDIYNGLENFEKVQELNASIFWCKKKLDVNQIDTYLAKLKDDIPDRKELRRKEKEVKAALATADKIVKAPVVADDAQVYLDRAHAFAQKNAGDHFAIYLRYYEVQERFIDSAPKVAAEALKLSTQSSTKYAEAMLSAKPSFDPNEVFNPPATGSQPVPDRVALREFTKQLESMDTVKNLLKEKGDARLAVPQQLLDLAIESEGEPGIAYAAALLAAEVAADRKIADINVIDQTAKWMLQKYEGLEYNTLMKELLKGLRTNPAGKAFLAILDNKDNPEANITLGLHYALKLKQQQLGWNLLIKGEAFNASISQIGKMELIKPNEANQQQQLADAYIGLIESKEYRSDEDMKTGAAQRATYWLKKALPELKGLGKSKAEQQMKDLEKLVPIDLKDIEWNNIDVATWEKLFKDLRKLGGRGIVVEANHNITPTGIRLTSNMRVRIVPHPGDRWAFRSRNGNDVVTNAYDGLDFYGNEKGGRYGKVAYSFNNNGSSTNVVNGKVIKGNGLLALNPSRPKYRAMNGKGKCRVLIIPIFED